MKCSCQQQSEERETVPEDRELTQDELVQLLLIETLMKEQERSGRPSK